MHKRCSAITAKLEEASKFKYQACANQQTEIAGDCPGIELSDAKMNKWICNLRPENNRIYVKELRTRVKLKSKRECLQGRRLQWFWHI